MALNNEQIESLKNAISSYSYPKVTFDFTKKIEIRHPSMRSVEKVIRDYLISRNRNDVVDGFSNILYWGHYRAGYCWTRVNNFREKISVDKIDETIKLIQNLDGTGITKIKEIKLPEFSNFSFISKARMFLNPHKFVVLDRKLMNIAKAQTNTVFRRIKEYKNYIPVTGNNESCYKEWCNICEQVATKYYSMQEIVAVDVERGFFDLIEKGRVEEAATIITNIS